MAAPALLEVCVDSPAGLVAAVTGGAGRIELCSALSLSGLTPAPGLMTLAARTGLPIQAMIRPLPGDFIYGPAEIDAMRADIDAARERGLFGVVLGASRPSGELDIEVLAILTRHAGGLDLTLHRAFDLVPDFPAALETAIALGFTRVLTSGGEPTAILGVDRIADLVTQAGDRIAIMAGAGLKAENVGALIRQTGVREVHGSCSGPIGEANPRVRALGFVAGDERETSAALVAAMAQAIGQAAP